MKEEILISAREKHDQACILLEMLNNTIKDEIAQRIATEVAPLRHKANQLEAAIKEEISNAYRDRKEAAQSIKNTTLDELNEIKKEAAASFWYPPGTIVCKWKNRGWHSDDPPVLTKEKGIVEIMKEDTIYPDNLSRYSIPHIGDVIIRLLLKDGTPGKKIIGMQKRWSSPPELDWDAQWWFPEGQPYKHPSPAH